MRTADTVRHLKWFTIYGLHVIAIIMIAVSAVALLLTCPLSTLDHRPALVVIDMQKGILRMPVAHPSTEIVQRVTSLADAFGRRQLPVVLVTVTGAPPEDRRDSRDPRHARRMNQPGKQVEEK